MSQRFASEEEVALASPRLKALRAALNNVLYGQEGLIDNLLVGMLARGHLLLEGLPGLGKTELVKAVAKALGLSARRIQFTPDLLPGDITGNPILGEQDGKRQFIFQPGPIFANVVLADEINRASPKTQSALLEAMQERQVTVMGDTRMLPEPFFVLATQNPIELEGTYPLPEAQLDRFLFKIEIHRSPVAVLQKIVQNREIGIAPEVPQVLSPDEFRELISLARRIYMPDAVANYIARVVHATHPEGSAVAEGVKFGASPRAALAMGAAAKARALLEGRLNASFEDVQAAAAPVLRHRIILDYRARVAGKTTADLVAAIVAEVKPSVAELPDSILAAKIR
jgi:MoxR-like ATPase